MTLPEYSASIDFSGRNILASENIPRKTLASRNLNIPGKTEHFFHYFTSSEDGEEDGEEEKGACVLWRSFSVPLW